MKASVVACLVFVLMIVLSMLSHSLLEDIMHQISNPLELAESFAAKEDINRAREEFYESKKIWENKRNLMELTVNNSHLYEISAFYEEAESSLAAEEMSEYIKKSRLIRLGVKNSISQQHLTLLNLF